MNNEQLITDNLRIVYHIYHSLGKTEFVKNNMDDLIGEGNYALVKAARSYSPDKSKFITYAARCVLNEMLMFMRRRKKEELCVSLFTPIGCEADGHELLLIDVLSDKTDFTYGVEENVILKAFYDKAAPRDKRLIKLRSQGLTHKDIGKKLGISQSYVSRLICKLKRKYRKTAAPEPGLKAKVALCSNKGGGHEKRRSTFQE